MKNFLKAFAGTFLIALGLILWLYYPPTPESPWGVDFFLMAAMFSAFVGLVGSPFVMLLFQKKKPD